MRTFITLVGIMIILSLRGNSQIINFYNISDNYYASGYMGDVNNIIIRKNYKDFSRPDSSCIKISYTPGDNGWGGICWQYPANNWCNKKGKDFSKAGFTKITFFVKGETGNEEVKFKVGQDCGDSFKSEDLTIKLSKSWRKYLFDLEGKDLTNITGAFCCIIDSHSNNGSVTLYLDDIQFEK